MIDLIYVIGSFGELNYADIICRNGDGHGLYKMNESGSGTVDRAEGYGSNLRDGGQMPEWYIWGRTKFKPGISALSQSGEQGKQACICRFAEVQERKKHYVEMESGPREPVRVGVDGQIINQIINEAVGANDVAEDESRQHMMEMAVSRAQEAAEAARMAAVKAQEAAAAADKAAEYAKKACL